MRVVKRLFFLVILQLFVSSAFGQGTIIDDEVYSPILGENRMVDVYLPPGYDQENDRVRYPVIYYLHGGQGDQDNESFIADSADELIENGEEPFIIVKPSGYEGPYLGMSWFANSDLNGYFEDFITQDLIAYIDSTYNTIPERDFRGIMGFSMGGFGAFNIGLKHPDIYCGTVAHSGALSLSTEYDEDIPIMISENGGSGPYDPNAGLYSTIMYSMGAAFSSNMENPPYYVDLPVDNDGVRIEAVWQRWLANDPSTLILDFEPEEDFGIYFDCGYSDHMLSSSVAFNSVIQELDIPYEYQNYEGNHTSLPIRFPVSLAYMDSLFWYGIPRIDELNLSPAYVMDEEEVSIQAQIVNDSDMDLSLTMSIETLEGESVDQVVLLDDGAHGDEEAGDNIYGGSWTVNVDLADFSLSLNMVEEGTGAEYLYPDCGRLTRRGPVVVSNINTIPENAIPQPGGMIFMQMEIMNQDGGETISDIGVRIRNESDLLTITGNTVALDSLEAGESIIPFGAMLINIDASCPVDTSFVFDIGISSQGYTYWVDQFTMTMGQALDVSQSESLPVKAMVGDIYPNPFNGMTKVSIDLPEVSDLRLELYNVLGQQVYKESFRSVPSGLQYIPLDFASYSSGTYFLQISVNQEHIKTAKLMLMK